MSAADTSTDAADTLARLMMARSGGERVAMVSDMFDAARQLALARIDAAAHTANPEVRRIQLFLQLHGSDLDDATIAAVVSRLSDPLEADR